MSDEASRNVLHGIRSVNTQNQVHDFLFLFQYRFLCLSWVKFLLPCYLYQPPIRRAPQRSFAHMACCDGVFWRSHAWGTPGSYEAVPPLPLHPGATSLLRVQNPTKLIIRHSLRHLVYKFFKKLMSNFSIPHGEFPGGDSSGLWLWWATIKENIIIVFKFEIILDVRCLFFVGCCGVITEWQMKNYVHFWYEGGESGLTTIVSSPVIVAGSHWRSR